MSRARSDTSFFRKIVVNVLPHFLVVHIRKYKRRNIEADRTQKTRKIISEYLARHSEPKLHLACGPNVLPGWLNTDLSPANKKVTELDAIQPLPFTRNSLSAVFTEHFIEHISLSQFRKLLKEISRTLKPGGLLRLATPDLDFVLQLRNTRNQKALAYLRWYQKSFHPGEQENIKEKVINGFFHNFGHQCLYDFEFLKTELKQAGFVNIQKQEVGRSKHRVLRNIEGHSKVAPARFNRLESLVVEAEKPVAPARR